MEYDLTNLDEVTAACLVGDLLAKLAEAREAVERQQRRVVGLRKMIDAVVEMFPATEDGLPEDLDDAEAPRPRGAEAVRRVLADNIGEWFTVQNMVSMLDKHQWGPDSSNPGNAVRTALERLVESKTIEKARSTKGAVIYRLPKPPPSPPTYDYAEEPF